MKTFYLSLMIILLAFPLTIAALPRSEARAQQGIEILDHKEEYTFGGQVTFWAKVRWDKPPAKVQIFYKSPDQTNTIVGEVSVRGDELIYVHDLVRYPLKAFSEIQYYYGIQMEGEAAFISPNYSFIYEDNRFTWQTLEDEPFKVHWYEGNLEFGQMVLDVAKNSLAHAQRLLDFPNPEKVDIYVYANSAEMLSTLNLGGIKNVVGHASPELGVMVVSLPKGSTQQEETQRQVPHELMHILLYRKLGQNYADLPAWLLEGLASLNETYPNPDYTTVLVDAVKKESLLPMVSLCREFPLETYKPFQSYAQSDSFTRFLYGRYGAEGMQSLIQAYANGLDCELGAEVGLGKSLTQLDALWQRKTFRKDLLALPWAGILLLVLLAPIILIINSLARGKASTRKVNEGSPLPGG